MFQKLSNLTLIIYVTILLNSDWLSYLFFNSTMGEGVTGFLFSVFFINLIKSKITPDNNFQSSTKLILIFFLWIHLFFKTFCFLPNFDDNCFIIF